MDNTRDAALADAGRIIAAQQPVTGKRVVMVTSLTHPPVVDREFAVTMPAINDMPPGPEHDEKQAILDYWRSLQADYTPVVAGGPSGDGVGDVRYFDAYTLGYGMGVDD